MMKLRLLRGFLPRPRPLKIFIRRSMGNSADTSDSSTNQDREAGRNSSKAEHSNPAPIGQFYRFLCRASNLYTWYALWSPSAAISMEDENKKQLGQSIIVPENWNIFVVFEKPTTSS